MDDDLTYSIVQVGLPDRWRPAGTWAFTLSDGSHCGTGFTSVDAADAAARRHMQALTERAP
jgi:hypothetical protein